MKNKRTVLIIVLTLCIAVGLLVVGLILRDKPQDNSRTEIEEPYSLANLLTLRDLEAYVKLAYAVNNEESFKKFEELSKELMIEDVYQIRVANFLYVPGNKPQVEIVKSGYTPTVEGISKYNILLNVVNTKTNVKTQVDCYVTMREGKIIDYVGY